MSVAGNALIVGLGAARGLGAAAGRVFMAHVIIDGVIHGDRADELDLRPLSEKF